MIIHANGTDLSRLISTVTWSGDTTQMARKLTFDYLYTRQDPNYPRINVEPGHRILGYSDGGRLLFDGIALGQDREESDIKMQISAWDFAWYTKNKTYGIYEGTSASITEQVCSEFGIPTGQLAPRNSELEIVSTGDKSISQIINKAYEDEEKEYFVWMNGRTLNVSPLGYELCGRVSGDDSVISAKYSSSIENMVNKVVIIDGDSNYLTEIAHGDDIAAYGQLQEVYKKASDDKDTLKEAAKLFKRIEQSGSITVKGDYSLTAGKAILVQEVNSKIYGKFTILTDSHSISDAEHKTTLKLKFDEVA